jgi:ATP-binding cassette, subfamily B, bacterial MsbA
LFPPYVIDCFRRRKRLVVLFFVTSFGRTFSTLASVLLLQQFLSVALGKKGAVAGMITRFYGGSNIIYILVVLMLVVTFATAFFTYWNALVTQKAVEVLELGLMRRLLRHILSLSVQYFHRRTQGDIIQTVRQDVVQLRTLVSSTANVIMDGTMVLAMAGVQAWLSPWLMFWSLIVLPLMIGPLVIFGTVRLRSLSKITRLTGYVLVDVILQILTGIRVIKAYQAEESETENGIRKSELFFDSLMKAIRVRAFGNVLIQTMGGLCFIVIIAVGTLQVARGTLTWPSLLAFAVAARALFTPLVNLYGDYLNIPTYKASMDRIGELLNTKPMVVDRPDARSFPTGPRQITFDDVDFSYGEIPVLQNLSFQVKAGETIGIVGPSGTGKSTLLNLIVRYYDPTSGRVSFDGNNLKDLRLADIYGKIAIVTQDPFLFATSVKENIRCGHPGATDDDVIAAADGASIHEDIMRLPSGYDTQIGAGGRELSRGQAQRINVARALLKSAPILLLDEATSSLDSVAEAEVQKSIDRLMQGRTSFVVAHRLSTLRNADRILVLDRGRLCAFGPHDLLLRECALYRNLWELQNLTVDLADNQLPLMAAPLVS